MTTQAFPSSTGPRHDRRRRSTLVMGGSLIGFGLLAAVAIDRAERDAGQPAATRREGAVVAATLASPAHEPVLEPSHVYVVASAEEAGLLLRQFEAITDASGTPASTTWRGAIRIATPADATGEPARPVCDGDVCITTS